MSAASVYDIYGSILPLDADLAALLDALSLQQKADVRANESIEIENEPDVPMSDEESYQSDTSASSSSSAARPSSPASPPDPCPLLQAIIGIYDPVSSEELEHFPTTCGAYLELLFTHRELFAASPGAHTGCPAGFSRLARALELRAWRADRECDSEAVAAFRHESWQVSAWLGSGGMWWGNQKNGV
ncbi:hypothetical protein K488DRAFT_67899 [Vararia minispora EC-137]|uniref:Uncharacterized protein n=1 Tax=Vararia minispora EC-137 TaxID=1314806 RepID=A0ACB8QX56_9AGAM|nr:hypothetical protein K488DRAFT_67899 [Vararia minispora EC-137]